MIRPRRILLYRLGSMGDTLVALPCIHSLRRWFPEAHITWLTNLPVNIKARAGTDLLAGTGLVDEYLSYPTGLRGPRELWALGCQLAAGRYDLVIDLAAARGLAKTVRDAAFFKACGFMRVVGLPWSKRDLHCLPDPSRPGLYEAESARLARRLAPLGAIDLADRSLWSLDLRPDELAAARRRLAEAGVGGRTIVASVGTKADAKDWTQANWIALLEKLGATHPDLGLVMLGAPDEHERSRICLDVWPGPKANLAGSLTVRESAAILQGAELFLGHDSGPMHLAAAVNTRCLAIFSAQNRPGHWYPAGPGHHVFYHQTECFGCGLANCVEHNKKCILAIKPAEVWSVACSFLQSPSGPKVPMATNG